MASTCKYSQEVPDGNPSLSQIVVSLIFKIAQNASKVALSTHQAPKGDRISQRYFTIFNSIWKGECFKFLSPINLTNNFSQLIKPCSVRYGSGKILNENKCFTFLPSYPGKKKFEASTNKTINILFCFY